MERFEDDVGFLLIHLVKKHRNMAEEALKRMGLHVLQDLILILLSRSNGMTQTELAAALQLELPTITKSVQRMEKSGFVVRRADDKDKRTSRVHLTEEGSRLYEPAYRQWRSLETRMLASFNEQEKANLRYLLQKAYANLLHDHIEGDINDQTKMDN